MSATTSTTIQQQQYNIINSSNCKYCYIDININYHRETLGFVAAFVSTTDSRYGFTSKELRYLGGSELKRIVDDQLISSDHDWSSKLASSNNNNYTITYETIRPPVTGNRIIIELDWDDCPITCENFATLCANGSTIIIVKKDDTNNTNSTTTTITTNTTTITLPIPIGECGKPLSYRNSVVHRIVPKFVMQGGDYIFGNGSGGESIYNNGKKFKDEKLGLIKKHNTRGIVSMGNSGKNSNSSQFFITFQATPQCDNKHVIFGRVISGWDILDQLENIGSTSGNGEPQQVVQITDCGIYTPLYSPGQGYWYNQPDPESFTGISPIFIVRPRVAVVAPNNIVQSKFYDILYPVTSITKITVDEYTTKNDDNNNKSTTATIINNRIVELLVSYAIDIVIVAPACTNIISKSIIQTKLEESKSSYWKNVATALQVVEPPLDINLFIIESKPFDALSIIHNDSWIAKYRTNWQLDGK